MKLFKSFDAPLHIILRRFKVIPIITLIFFMGLTCWVTAWYMTVALSLNSWGVAPVLGYLTTLTGCVKFCLDAIRKGEEKDEHDKET